MGKTSIIVFVDDTILRKIVNHSTATCKKDAAASKTAASFFRKK